MNGKSSIELLQEMINKLSRRKVIRVRFTAGTLALSGCFVPDAEQRNRFLGFEDIEVVDRDGDRYTVRVVPRTSLVGGDGWARFHDVLVIGLDEEGDVVCESRRGTITKSDTLDAVSLNCNGFPHTIRYDARESTCSEDTEIARAEYDGKRDERHVWRSVEPECEVSKLSVSVLLNCGDAREVSAKAQGAFEKGPFKVGYRIRTRRSPSVIQSPGSAIVEVE